MRKNRILLFLNILFVLLGVLIISLTDFVKINYPISFETLLYTLTSPVEGTGSAVVRLVVFSVVPPVLYSLLFCLPLLICVFQSRVSVFLNGKNMMRVFRLCFTLLSAAVFFASFFYTFRELDIGDYVKKLSQKTEIYEQYYISPESISIKAPEKKRNLLLIYLESMETIYTGAPDDDGTVKNFIPGLTSLAESEISFSDNDGIGGFYCTPGASWTLASLFATTSGIPFSFPIEPNSSAEYERIAPGVTNLGDILEGFGYSQEFLCGSPAPFAGRDKLYLQHGNYSIYDYNTAVDKGIIDKDHYVWWGLEDYILYDIAKSELIRLSEQDEPFNLTMLTVDTHHKAGYICPMCGSDNINQLGNVLNCADRLLCDFIAWVREQEFYEDTAIVIIGDHPRMDSYLVGSKEWIDRSCYNCFINSSETPALSEKNRSFVSLDIFPSILAAMGFDIEGDRIGLGTNLFSAESTLAEDLGLAYLDDELAKHSEYYLKNFA